MMFSWDPPAENQSKQDEIKRLEGELVFTNNHIEEQKQQIEALKKAHQQRMTDLVSESRKRKQKEKKFDVQIDDAEGFDASNYEERTDNEELKMRVAQYIGESVDESWETEKLQVLLRLRHKLHFHRDILLKNKALNQEARDLNYIVQYGRTDVDLVERRKEEFKGLIEDYEGVFNALREFGEDL